MQEKWKNTERSIDGTKKSSLDGVTSKTRSPEAVDVSTTETLQYLPLQKS